MPWRRIGVPVAVIVACLIVLGRASDFVGCKPKPPKIPSADDCGSQPLLWPGSLTFSRTKRP